MLIDQPELGYRKKADLLMAYSHQIKNGITTILLPDFEGPNKIEISLKRDLTVFENAERFYRKARGQAAENVRILHNLTQWEVALKENNRILIELANICSWDDLKPFLVLDKINENRIDDLPYHTHLFLEYEIWVGKNAKSNDEMLRHAHKNDLWLHARDVAGSHVIIRNKGVGTIPNPVIERAAELASFYSKAKTNALSPVMVTYRKYVRKGKSMLPGQVKVEKEKTLLVTPKP